MEPIKTVESEARAAGGCFAGAESAGRPRPCGRRRPPLRVLALAVAGLWIGSGPLAAWDGHDWNEWQRITTWRRPELQSRQAGRSEPVRLLEAAEGEEPIDSIGGWEARRAGIATAVAHIIGVSQGLTVPPPEARQDGEERLPDHIRRHIRIRSEEDDWIPAYLLIPADMPAGRHPTMICLHQTVPYGKDEPCGIRGDSDLFLAVELVRRGMVCIAPDAIGFGERIPAGAGPYTGSLAFYRRQPGWSLVGKMNWDISRIVDYLETLPFVDPLQIGCVGHSHGAYGSLLAAAFEPRISAVIASCGFNLFRSDPQPDRWSHRTPLLPQLGTYLPDVASIPIDWHEILALLAPRPLFVWYATNDAVFPRTDALDAVLQDVRRVYGLYGAASEIRWKAFEGGHGFPPAGRREAFEWLTARFFPAGEIHRIPADLATWERRRETIRKVVRRTVGQPTLVPPPVAPRVLSVEQWGRRERRLIEYEGICGDPVRAWLCRTGRQQGRRPGILVLHQTTVPGKDESIGICGDPTLAFGAELADRGYVTLSPDAITAGDRIDAYGPYDTRGHYLACPDLSAMGRMLEDARRALDVLASDDGVDPGRIGVIGHSLGGHQALLLTAFDERVRAAVISCAFSPFRAESPDCRMGWARADGFSYLPRLRPVFELGRLPHWDWDDVLRLAAPRAVYQYHRTQDEFFPASWSTFEAGEAARAVWRLYDRRELLVNVLRPGAHGIDEPDKRAMYEWLDRQLQPAS